MAIYDDAPNVETCSKKNVHSLSIVRLEDV
jgi:hypothetical protein